MKTASPIDTSAWLRDCEVHRDAFIDPDLFALEMQTVFTHT